MASMRQPPLQVSRLFSGSCFPYIVLLCYLSFFCTQGGSLVIFFPFCAAEVLPCQLKHKGIEQPAWIRARLLCRALPGQHDHLTSILPCAPGAEQGLFWDGAGQLEQRGVITATVWLYRKVSFCHTSQNTSGILVPRALGRRSRQLFSLECCYLESSSKARIFEHDLL